MWGARHEAQRQPPGNGATSQCRDGPVLLLSEPITPDEHSSLRALPAEWAQEKETEQRIRRLEAWRAWTAAVPFGG